MTRMGQDGGVDEPAADSSPASDSADTTSVNGPSLAEAAHPDAHGRQSAWPFVTLGILALLTAGAVGLAIAQKGGGSSDANAALQRAVTTTLHSKTAKTSLSLTIGVGSGQQSLTVFGKGDTNLVTDGTNLTMTFSVGGQTITERAIVDGSTGYFNIGPVVGSIIPGKSWVSEDQGGASNQVVGSGGVFNDPATLIAVLRAQGTQVRSVGTSTVQGLQVEGYALHLGRAGIEKSIRSERLSPSARQSVASARFKALDYQVFVDESDHMRRIRASGAFSEGGLGATVASTIDFTDFGTPVTITPPPASEVVPIGQFEKIAQQNGGNALT